MSLPIPPKKLLPLPKGHIYLGQTKDFKQLPDNKKFTGSIYNPEESTFGWQREDRWGGDSDFLHYSAPFDSEIAKLNGFPEIPPEYELVGFAPNRNVQNHSHRFRAFVPVKLLVFRVAKSNYAGTGDAYYFIHKKNDEKQRWEFDIEGNCKLYGVGEIPYETVKALAKWLDSAPIFAGEIPCIEKLRIGCQSFIASEIEGFVQEFKAEKWREPEVRFSIGSRFKWGNTEYILAQAGANQVTFINTEHGTRLTGPINVDDVIAKGTTLKELAAFDKADARTIMELKPISIKKAGE